ncbi:MAG TPA: PspC domain-containing protein [Anaerolineae bacterium]|nr:PspC domain-containing protein [Anaerolineae bacterium]
MSEEPKKLYRARDDRMLAGVCGGLGKYFGIDPTVLRVLFVAAAVLGVGGGIILYILMMILVPEEPG